MNPEALHPPLLPRILLKHGQLPFVSFQKLFRFVFLPLNLSIGIFPLLCVYLSCLRLATQTFQTAAGGRTETPFCPLRTFQWVRNQSELRCLHAAFSTAVILQPSVRKHTAVTGKKKQASELLWVFHVSAGWNCTFKTIAFFKRKKFAQEVPCTIIPCDCVPKGFCSLREFQSTCLCVKTHPAGNVAT